MLAVVATRLGSKMARRIWWMGNSHCKNSYCSSWILLSCECIKKKKKWIFKLVIYKNIWMPSHEKRNEVSVLKPDSQVLLWAASKLHFQPDILQLSLCLYPTSGPFLVPKKLFILLLTHRMFLLFLSIKTLPNFEGPAQKLHSFINSVQILCKPHSYVCFF